MSTSATLFRPLSTIIDKRQGTVDRIQKQELMMLTCYGFEIQGHRRSQVN